MKKILVILGPTSTGKTDLAINLAKKFNGEIISADSRQVYKNLDIGTGKLPGKFENLEKKENFWEVDEVPIHMYDVVSPNIQFTVADYVIKANQLINQIFAKKRLPMIVGGTGLYIKAITEGLSNLNIPFDKKLRKNLQELTLLELQNKLKKLSISKWEDMNYSDQQNPRRLIRAIELQKAKSKKPNTVQKKEYEFLIVGLTAPKEILYKKSDDRVVKRIRQGLISEANVLHKNGLSIKRMKELGLEYGVLADYLEKKISSEDELVKILQNKIHGYIKRQLTWFKKQEKNPKDSSRNINWFDITKKSFQDQIEKIISQWYYQP